MSSASVSPHGFVTVRGRGYRPVQVDVYAAELSLDRDAAWERAARLTVLAKEMEAEAAGVRETLARLAPQTYEALGERARRLFQLAQEEAAAVRERARSEAQQHLAHAEAHALGVRRAAQEYADELRAEAEERARQRLLAARAEVDEIRITARREVKESRGEVLSALREMRQRTSGMLAEQAKEHAERWAEAEREAVERADALDAHHAHLVARAEAALTEAKQALADGGQSVHGRQEDAQARAAELLVQAQAHADRIARETEQVLREHGERWDDVRAQLDHVRSSLADLTGRASVE
ncbi:cellulose-binding protein [Streptomyces sp. NPDC001315]|uniref:cellulose-binding protein n=1 Tax=Streptomyces sp. NPDC001315 TaxID=3364562 RepID=UPI0036CCA524